MDANNRWKCEECDHICTTAERLTAPNPFADTDEISGCPNCKAVQSLEVACATVGCTRLGTCGGKGADGVYRFTCYEHADWLHAPAASPSAELSNAPKAPK